MNRPEAEGQSSLCSCQVVALVWARWSLHPLNKIYKLLKIFLEIRLKFSSTSIRKPCAPAWWVTRRCGNPVPAWSPSLWSQNMLISFWQVCSIHWLAVSQAEVFSALEIESQKENLEMFQDQAGICCKHKAQLNLSGLLPLSQLNHKYRFDLRR